MTTSATLSLVYAIGGSAVLMIFLRLFDVKHSIWQPLLASAASGLCQYYLPVGVNSIAAFAAPLLIMRLTTNGSWTDQICCAVGTRIVLIVIFMVAVAGTRHSA
jgi:hypothetical protein